MAGKKKGEKAPKKELPNKHRDTIDEKIAKAQKRVDANKSESNISDQHLEKITNKVGRPSSYDPRYNKMVLDVMRQGKSIASVAALIGVGRQKLYDWAKIHPEFQDTLELGRELSQQYWEELSRGMGNGQFSQDDITARGVPNMVQFVLSRNFSDYYNKTQADIKSEVKQTHEVYVFESQLAEGVIRQKSGMVENQQELDNIINEISGDLCQKPESE